MAPKYTVSTKKNYNTVYVAITLAKNVRYIHNQAHAIWLGCVQILNFYLTLSRVVVFRGHSVVVVFIFKFHKVVAQRISGAMEVFIKTHKTFPQESFGERIL